MQVEVTQYLRPDGRTAIMHTDIHEAFDAPYSVIKQRGWRIAAEVLTDETISITVEDDEQDFAHELVANGPEVPRAIERALTTAICAVPVGE